MPLVAKEGKRTKKTQSLSHEDRRGGEAGRLLALGPCVDLGPAPTPPSSRTSLVPRCPGEGGACFFPLVSFDCQVVFWGNDLPIPSGVALTWVVYLNLK